MTPTNTCGWNVEHYSEAGGWVPCTQPVATLAEAQAQLAKLGVESHRVYWAIKAKDSK